MSSYPNAPYQQPQQPQQPPGQPKNGLGTAGFILGLIGAIFSLIPIIGVIAWFLVIPGLVLAAVGFARTRKGEATNAGLAIAGIVLSLVGLLFCILYAAAFATAVSDATSGIPGGEPHAFGTIAKSGDVAVSVSAPAKFAPSSSAVSMGGPIVRAVAVNITITNNGAESYQFNPFIVGAKATAGGAAAPEITDLEKGAGAAAEATILPGKSYTYKVAFSVPEQPGEFQVGLSSSIFGSDVVFAGTA
ncbi:MAG: DUF4352 domain-containing protein [Pseudonocardiaceae bacterium]